MKPAKNSSIAFEQLSIKQKKTHVKTVRKSSQYDDKKLLNLYRTHENSLLCMSLFSMLVILQSGLLPIFTYLCLLAPWFSWWFRKKKIKHFPLSGSVISSAGFIWAISRVVMSGLSYAVLAATIALLGILTGRILSRETLTHDLQVILLAFALCLASTVVTPSLMFVPFFVLFSIFSILALTTRQLIKGFEESTVIKGKSRAHQALISWKFLLSIVFVSQTVMAFSILVFISFPRLGANGFQFSGQDSFNFPDAVDLSASPWGRTQSNKVVARVKGVALDDFVRGLYLRGGVYEKLSTQGFSQRPKRLLKDLDNLRLVSHLKNKKYRVELQPFAQRVIFSLGNIQGIWPTEGQKIDDFFRIKQGPQGELAANRRLKTIFKYEVFGEIISPSVIKKSSVEIKTNPNETNATINTDAGIRLENKELLSEEERIKQKNKAKEKALAQKIELEKQNMKLINKGRTTVFYEVPTNLDPRVKELALKLSKGAANADQIASQLSDALINNYRYTRNFSSEGSKDAVSDFLLISRAGHCEYFATAFALMMRTLGYPSRVIGGFQGGVLEPSSGDILFKQKNAHAWVEWYHPVKGWQLADPTPTPQRGHLGVFEQLSINMKELWDNYVVNFSVSEQILALKAVGVFWKKWRDQILLSILGLLLILVLSFLLYQRLKEKRRRSRHKIVDVFLTIVRITLEHNILAYQTNRELLDMLSQSDCLSEGDFTEIKHALFFHEQRAFADKKLNEIIYKKKYNILLGILKKVKERRYIQNKKVSS